MFVNVNAANPAVCLSAHFVRTQDTRHNKNTAENIKTWTDEALEAIGLKGSELLEPTE